MLLCPRHWTRCLIISIYYCITIPTNLRCSLPPIGGIVLLVSQSVFIKSCIGSWGHFEGERVGTPFPLLECLRTHHGRHCVPFSGGQKLTRLQDIAYINLKNFLGLIPLTSAKAPLPDINFLFAHQRSHCSCFAKRPLFGFCKTN